MSRVGGAGFKLFSGFGLPAETKDVEYGVGHERFLLSLLNNKPNTRSLFGLGPRILSFSAMI